MFWETLSLFDAEFAKTVLHVLAWHFQLTSRLASDDEEAAAGQASREWAGPGWRKSATRSMSRGSTRRGGKADKVTTGGAGPDLVMVGCIKLALRLSGFTDCSGFNLAEGQSLFRINSWVAPDFPTTGRLFCDYSKDSDRDYSQDTRSESM